MSFQITCSGPGPHIPDNGIIGTADQAPTMPMYCTSGPCMAASHPAPTVQELNIQTLQGKAQNALAGNQTFLGLATPTQAQAIAQVQALTRQVDALIKLTLGLLSDTSGT